MGKIRVLVASDYQIVRSALRQLLKIDDAFDVLMTETTIGKALPRTCQSNLTGCTTARSRYTQFVQPTRACQCFECRAGRPHPCSQYE